MLEVINTSMLLIDLKPLVESLSYKVGFIHPQSNKVITDSKYNYHLQAIVDQPEEFGVDPDELFQEIGKYDNDVDAWSDDVDDIFSKYHRTAYENGWVRWFQVSDRLNLSGYAEGVLAALAMPMIRQTIQSYPGIHLTIDWLPSGGGKVDALNKQIHNVHDLSAVRRQLRSS